MHGDRHPKISDNVLIGASASILGNIRVGKGAQVSNTVVGKGLRTAEKVQPHTKCWVDSTPR